MEQPHGYGSNVNAFVAAHARTAQGATFVMRPVKTTDSKPVKARQIHGKPQQGSSPTCPNHPPKNCLMLPSERNGLTSPDRQLRKHEKTVQKPCSGWSCGWSCNGSFGGSSGLRSARSRNSQTPAGFKPNLSKNQPPKNYLTSPSDAHEKDEERPTPMPDITRQAASKA